MSFSNEFSWSKSRDSAFRECLRSYYYTNYGSWGGWDRDAPEQSRELYVLKNLKTAPLWLGIVVHDAAERVVKATLNRLRLTPDDACAELEKRMRQEHQLSKDGAHRQGRKIFFGGKQVKVNGLSEHHFGLELDLESLIEQALHCIRTLFQTQAYDRIRQLSREAVLTIEELLSFEVDGVRVWVKLDMAVKTRTGSAVIIDWKTGGSNRQDDVSMQLGIYGLFAMERWQLQASQVSAYDVNLRDGSARTHQIETSLDQVTDYIRESSGAMRALLEDVQSNTPKPLDAFPMTDQTRQCRFCSFRGVCQRG